MSWYCLSLGWLEWERCNLVVKQKNWSVRVYDNIRSHPPTNTLFIRTKCVMMVSFFHFEALNGPCISGCSACDTIVLYRWRHRGFLIGSLEFCFRKTRFGWFIVRKRNILSPSATIISILEPQTLRVAVCRYWKKNLLHSSTDVCCWVKFAVVFSSKKKKKPKPLRLLSEVRPGLMPHLMFWWGMRF